MRHHTFEPKNYTLIKQEPGAYTAQVILQVPHNLRDQLGRGKITKLVHGISIEEIHSKATQYVKAHKNTLNWLRGPTTARLTVDISKVVMTEEVIAAVEDAVRNALEHHGVEVDDIVTADRPGGLTRREQLANRKPAKE